MQAVWLGTRWVKEDKKPVVGKVSFGISFFLG